MANRQIVLQTGPVRAWSPIRAQRRVLSAFSVKPGEPVTAGPAVARRVPRGRRMEGKRWAVLPVRSFGRGLGSPPRQDSRRKHLGRDPRSQV